MKSSFQTILVILFVVVFAGAVMVFSGIIPIGSKQAAATPSGTVVMWGTAPQTLMQQYVDSLVASVSGEYAIRYIERDVDTFEQDMIVALANGNAPDLVMFPSELIERLKSRLYVIPYAAYSERLYRDTHIEGAQLFLRKDGVLALPLVVDPLVVYYNKDILAAKNFVVPPKTWSDLQRVIPLLTIRDTRGTITQSTIALGGVTNVAHARDILSALFLQTGNSIVSYQPSTDSSSVVLGMTPAGAESAPTAQALEFYTSFANPTSSNYSWNSGFPSSLIQFIAGKSAFYIGRASELFTIQAQNPNLNFDVSELFQTGVGSRPITFGSFTAVGVMKNAPNFTTAYAAATAMSSAAGIDALSKTLSLAPARRDLLLVQQANPYVSTFFTAALSAFGWADPNPVTTTATFQSMVADVQSGKSVPQTALFEAVRKLQSAL